LDEFMFRFNRRFYRSVSFRSLLDLGTLNTGITYREVYDKLDPQNSGWNLNYVATGYAGKNHPLADGNKRSGSFLFLWYLRLNQSLLAKPVEQLINDNTLVALALLVAESLPEQKELMVRLIQHFVLLK